jgi:hypothetical protein
MNVVVLQCRRRFDGDANRDIFASRLYSPLFWLAAVFKTLRLNAPQAASFLLQAGLAYA